MDPLEVGEVNQRKWKKPRLSGQVTEGKKKVHQKNKKGIAKRKRQGKERWAGGEHALVSKDRKWKGQRRGPTLGGKKKKGSTLKVIGKAKP